MTAKREMVRVYAVGRFDTWVMANAVYINVPNEEPVVKFPLTMSLVEVLAAIPRPAVIYLWPESKWITT